MYSSYFMLSELILIRLSTRSYSLEIFFFNQFTVCLSPPAEYSQQKYLTNLTTCCIYFMVLFHFTRGFYFLLLSWHNFLLLNCCAVINYSSSKSLLFYPLFSYKIRPDLRFLKSCFLYSGCHCKWPYVCPLTWINFFSEFGQLQYIHTCFSIFFCFLNGFNWKHQWVSFNV